MKTAPKKLTAAAFAAIRYAMSVRAFAFRGWFLALLLFMATSLGARADLRSDLEVQKLANFSLLQKLEATGTRESTRAYLARVSHEYRKAGYGAFAARLPEARSLLEVFGAPNLSARALREARSAARHLKEALTRNRRVAVPAVIGKRIPNYYGIALAFLENSDQALENVSAGRSAAFGLRKRFETSWVRKIGAHVFSVQGSLIVGGAFRPGPVSVGSTTISGISTTGAGFAVLGGAGSSLVRPVSETVMLRGRWAAFLPGVQTPDGFAGFLWITWPNSFVADGVEYPAGTRLLSISGDLAVPEGGVLLATPIELTFIWPAPDPSSTQDGTDVTGEESSEASISSDSIPPSAE